jgi:hypothetical protein
MPVKQLSDGGPDGTTLGQSSTDKVAFYGTTPIVRPAATTLGALTAGTTTAANVAAALVDLRTQLVSLGLISST